MLMKLVRSYLDKDPFIVKLAENIVLRKKRLNIFRRFDPKVLFQKFQHREKSLDPGLYSCKYLITDQVLPDSTINKFDKVVSSLDDLNEDEIKKSVFYIYFLCDSDALPVVQKIKSFGGKFIPHLDPGKTDYRFVNRQALNAMRKSWLKSDRVSPGEPIIHENICEALEITKNIEGDYVEIGVFQGRSALTALHYLAEMKNSNHKSRKVWLLDTFDGFNYPEAKTSSDAMWGDTHKLYGVEKTILYLKETLAGIDIPFELVESNICADDLPEEIKKIAVANIDVDMYEPTLSALNKVAPLIPLGGIIIAEDPASTPALYGAYLALNEFLESDIGQKFTPIFKHGQYFLFRTVN